MKYDWSTFPKKEDSSSAGEYVSEIWMWVKNHKAELRDIVDDVQHRGFYGRNQFIRELLKDENKM